MRAARTSGSVHHSAVRASMRLPSATALPIRAFSVSTPSRMPSMLACGPAMRPTLPQAAGAVRAMGVPRIVRRMYAEASEAKPQESAPAGEKPAHPEMPAQEGAQTLQAELTQVKAETTKLKEMLTQRDTELQQMKSNLMYAVAEKENIKRLTKQEADNARAYGIQKFALDLAEVADTFKLALRSVKDEDLKASPNSMREMYKGVELTSKTLHKAFGNHGLIEVDPLGKKFDPQVCNAVMQIGANEKPGLVPGSVYEVFKTAYTLNDRLIRPAMVKVVEGSYPSPKPAPAAAPSSSK